MQGHVAKKKDNWYVVLELDRDDGGKRQQKWISVRKELGLNKKATKKQAEGLLVEKLRDLQTGMYFEPSEIPLGDYLIQWLEGYGKNNLRQTTLDSYESTIRLHIVPGLGKIAIKDLKPAHIQRIYDQKLGELSTRSVRYIHSILSKALKQAVKLEYIPRNVAESVTPPALQQEEMEYWTQEQAQVFLAAAEKERLYPLLFIALTTGMRRGELLALKWSDINFSEKIISVRRNLTVSKRQIQIGEPKTKKSKRTIDISDEDVRVLKEHKLRQTQELLVFGKKNAEGWVFTKAKSPEPLYPTATRILERVIKRTDLPEICFHSLRHTHATLMLSKGVSPKIVQERLGHATISITLDTYGHVIPGLQKQAAETLAGSLFARDRAMAKITDVQEQ